MLYKATYPNLATCLQAGLMAYSSSGGTDITAVFDHVQLIPAGTTNTAVHEIFAPAKEAVQLQSQGASDNGMLKAKIELADDADAQRRLQVYPNPANGEAFVSLPVIKEGQQAVLSLYNSVGQEVLRRRVDGNTSRTALVPLDQLDAGVYVFRLKVKGQADLTQRLVIGR